MSALPMVLTAAGALLSAAQTVVSTQDAKAQAKNQAAQARYQAELAEQDARLAREEAARQENELRRQASHERARQRALLAEDGVLESRSSQTIMEQKAGQDEREALAIKYQGDLKAQGLMANSQVSRNVAIIADRKARSAQTNGFLALGQNLVKSL